MSMDPQELSRLCEALSISEVDGPRIKFTGDIKEAGSKKISLCLVGKVLANRQVNRDAFRATIPKIWRINSDVAVEVVRQNVFAFHFKELADRRWVLSGGPWSFDGALRISVKICLFFLVFVLRLIWGCLPFV
ncbi:hypothetical protein ACOSP7_025691 [Xanthoceras sorbifolium]